MLTRSAILTLLSSCLALAQTRFADSFQSLTNAYRVARTEGRFGEAARRRADARDLLQRLSPDAPQFTRLAMEVSRLYAHAARTAEARAVLEDAVKRGGNRPQTADLLSELSIYWAQDRSLMSAIRHAEQAVVADERSGRAHEYLYQNLSALYRQAGREDEVPGVVAKLRARVPDSGYLASMEDGIGNTEAAEAAYLQQVANSKEANRSATLLTLANFYEQHERFAEAAASLQQAIAITGNQSPWFSTNLARVWTKAGNTEAADQVYQTALTQRDAPWTTPSNTPPFSRITSAPTRAKAF